MTPYVRSKGTTPVNAAAYAELAKELNTHITIIHISSENFSPKCLLKGKLGNWKKCLGIPNTMKMHCVKLRNQNQLEVAKTSNGEAFKVANIFTAPSSPTDDESDQSNGDNELPSETVQEEIHVGDWVLICYENDIFPREVTTVATNASDIEVNVMHKAGATFWKWPARMEKIFYTRDNVVKNLGLPTVAGTHVDNFHLI